MSVEVAEGIGLTALSESLTESPNDASVTQPNKLIDNESISANQLSVQHTEKNEAPDVSGASDMQSSTSEEKLTSQIREHCHLNDDDSKEKLKGPKTFDKETFVEAPLPKTNPWKKNIPPSPPAETPKAISSNVASEEKNDQCEEDKQFTVVSSHRHSGRSPRSSKNMHRFHGPAHRNDFKPVHSDHRVKYKKGATTKPPPLNAKQSMSNSGN